ncbi:hypothetical protein CEXT_640461 [Caerostris extrusa]|uniref:Uncharacterized protein n=1 Tax=Caerostris extrusa TaxID=172846 RepID=A0AAV4WPN6_CAEEX|nr:hypothetical protein CEXT_640461 [Caerostris extrusa]
MNPLDISIPIPQNVNRNTLTPNMPTEHPSLRFTTSETSQSPALSKPIPKSESPDLKTIRDAIEREGIRGRIHPPPPQCFPIHVTQCDKDCNDTNCF